MPRKLALVAVLFTVAAVMTFSGESSALAGVPTCGRALFGQGVKCAGGVSSGNGGTPGSDRSGGGSGRPAGRRVVPDDLVYVTEITSVGGQDCTFVVAITPAEEAQGLLTTLIAVPGPIEGPLVPCPVPPGPGVRGRVLPVSPAQLAERFWYSVRLPVPKPVSQPDFGVTGKLVYLQAGDTNTPPAWTRATPFGALEITAHGVYTVDWGDGSTSTGPYTTPGGPYPRGVITHTYDVVGTVTITVREYWKATWTIGARGGTLADLRTTGTLPDFPIRQIQAVITG
jgi:hypothetical protein